jgi:hypothetical protein
LAKQKDWQTGQAQRYAWLKQAYDALDQRAAESLVLKQNAAKASTIGAILAGSHQVRLPDAEIVSAFQLLDEEQQAALLQVFSSRIPLPSMTGPLEAILDKPKFSDVSLRERALQTLLKVNPERGQARILAEIREPHADSFNNAGFLARCLSWFPNETLPELDGWKRAIALHETSMRN